MKALVATCGRPFGTTLIAPSFSEVLLVDIGGEFHRRAGVPMGAGRRPLPNSAGVSAPQKVWSHAEVDGEEVTGR